MNDARNDASHVRYRRAPPARYAAAFAAVPVAAVAVAAQPMVAVAVAMVAAVLVASRGRPGAD